MYKLFYTHSYSKTFRAAAVQEKIPFFSLVSEMALIGEGTPIPSGNGTSTVLIYPSLFFPVNPPMIA